MTAAIDEAADQLKSARRDFDLASAAYDRARRDGLDLTSAHRAWALAGHDWLTALITHAAARDAEIIQKRTA